MLKVSQFPREVCKAAAPFFGFRFSGEIKTAKFNRDNSSASFSDRQIYGCFHRIQKKFPSRSRISKALENRNWNLNALGNRSLRQHENGLYCERQKVQAVFMSKDQIDIAIGFGLLALALLD